MKNVAELLKAKPPRMVAVKPEDSVLEAIKVLAREDIGAAVVMSGDRLAGIFSVSGWSSSRGASPTRRPATSSPTCICCAIP